MEFDIMGACYYNFRLLNGSEDPSFSGAFSTHCKIPDWRLGQTCVEMIALPINPRQGPVSLLISLPQDIENTYFLSSHINQCYLEWFGG